MKSLNDVIEKVADYKISELVENIHTILPGRIVSVNFVDGYCDCEVMIKRWLIDKYEKFPQLIQVILDYDVVGDWEITKGRQKGDLIWLGFSEFAFDTVVNNINLENPVSREKFGLNAPLILGSYKLDSKKFSIDNSADLKINNPKNGTILLLKTNGDIEITAGSSSTKIISNVEIEGKLNVTESITTPVIKATNKAEIKKAIINDKDYEEHAHGGVETGKGKTGVPE